MIAIETYTSTKFKLDGIPYLKNYISEVAGSQIIIFNAYDRKDVRVDWEHYGNITLNGVVYANVADLQSALLPVIYTRASLGGADSSLTIYESGETPIVDINEIEVIGATVTDDGSGKVTLEIVAGTTPNLQQVTDEDNETTNEIISNFGFRLKSLYEGDLLSIFDDGGLSVLEMAQGSIRRCWHLDVRELEIKNPANGYFSRIRNTSGTAFRTVYIPDKNGTIAFLDDIPSGGAVDSVNGQTGVVVLDADDIDETATRVYVTPTQKTAITHSNRATLDAITEAFTTALKSNYDSAYTWVNTNGATVLSFISNIATTVRGTLLTGLSTATGGAILPTDTILQGFGKAQRQIDNGVMVLLNDATSSASLTGTTTETQIGSSILIPANTFAIGDSFTIDAQLNRNATAISTANFKARINTTNTFAGATQIAIAQQGAIYFSCPLIRTACFKTASNFEIIASGSATNNDLIASSTVVASTIAFDTTVDNYLFFSGQLFNVADSFYLSRVTITKRKSKSTI